MFESWRTVWRYIELDLLDCCIVSYSWLGLLIKECLLHSWILLILLLSEWDSFPHLGRHLELSALWLIDCYFGLGLRKVGIDSQIGGFDIIVLFGLIRELCGVLQRYSLPAHPLLCDRHGVHELKLAAVDSLPLLTSHRCITHSINLTKVDVNGVSFDWLISLSSFCSEAWVALSILIFSQKWLKFARYVRAAGVCPSI